MIAVTTIGHGTLSAEEFLVLVRDAEIDHIVDVRSFPGSRRNPQFGREQMAQWLTDAGTAYTWLPDLGGRRRGVPNSPNVALRNDAFRAYADYMRTDDFHRGVEELLTIAATEHAATMCSETVWWRCHRRLLADHLVLVQDIEVGHLMHDGRIRPHVVTEGARRDDDKVVYDVGGSRRLPL